MRTLMGCMGVEALYWALAMADHSSAIARTFHGQLGAASTSHAGIRLPARYLPTKHQTRFSQARTRQ
ncbi:unnamed protein product [Mycetohabitans rhizoxinica HKI 454]|uniref:Uncharacterized protein n=1 Tax=Mycetohabitans rhizoxinica (strain DSM 19002 / CIP 109453 / HKI 454) TaxID=882378 RepID=E5AST1_MYCRK|nr:unnamed protein product [Mycetohabitans rhizoxinica HKI 454]